MFFSLGAIIILLYRRGSDVLLLDGLVQLAQEVLVAISSLRLFFQEEEVHVELVVPIASITIERLYLFSSR